MSAISAPSPTPNPLQQVRNGLLNYGFVIVLVVIFLYLSLATPNFFGLTNLMGLLHAAAPLSVIAAGLALVVFTGKLDISVGSIALLSVTIGSLLLVRYSVHPLVCVLVILAIGAGVGAINGFFIVALKINPLIVTLGMMLALRGLALQISEARFITLPDDIRALGSAQIGPVFVDVLIALGVLAVVHVIHTRTAFGRQLMAIGNGEEVAAGLGVRVNRLTFMTYVISGLLASFGGILSAIQVGTVSAFLGDGLEFTAVSVIVIGGISLFGGAGSILPGLLLGVLLLEMIRNGLTHLGASPYSYRLVNGIIIFVAMYADSLKSQVQTRLKVKRDG
jgi:ribose/xylose/arabinose/galactoside ABC-type transport system permease subunit